MDATPDRGGLEQTYRLLALCARAQGHPVFYDQLNAQLRAFHSWDSLPAQAERLGMAPLFWYHVHQANIALPDKTERILHALYFREGAFNRLHLLVLLEISLLFKAAGIRAVLLKGLGLAYQYYPDPALRPVSDIDFLLQESDVLPALEALAAAGFRVDSLAHTRRGRMPRELTADSPPHDGLRTHVELHHLHPGGTGPNDELVGVDASPQSLLIENQRILVPAPADTLRYLCRHLRRHLFEATDDRPLQLKWAADMVTVAERHATELDWVDIQRRQPDLLARLEVFYCLTPMPEACAGLIPVKPRQPPPGPNQYPQAWPQHLLVRLEEDRPGAVPAANLCEAVGVVAAALLRHQRTVHFLARAGCAPFVDPEAGARSADPQDAMARPPRGSRSARDKSSSAPERGKDRVEDLGAVLAHHIRRK